MSKRLKTLMARELSEVFRENDSCVLLGVGALTVERSMALRNELREKGARLRVLRNRVARFAMREAGIEELGEHLQGASAVAFGGEGAPAISKILLGWEKKLPGTVTIRAGLLDGRLLEGDEVRTLATIPEKPVLLSLLASLVAAPVSQVASLMNEILAGVARGVGALAEKRAGDS